MKVSRLIQKARREGVVKIIIDYGGSFVDLENCLVDKYGLDSAIVVDGSAQSNTRAKVSAAAAFFLENNLIEGSTVAVGWGTTLDMIPDYLHRSAKKFVFSPIIGGHGKHELNIHASSVAAKFAKKTNSESFFLLAPAFAQSEKQKEVLLNDRSIKEVLARSASADYAFFSLGNPQESDNSIVRSGYFSEEEIMLLRRENAICDMVSVRFLNDKGHSCCENITKRSIGIHAEELKRIPVKICVVDGKSKYQAVKTALEAHYINVLILDNVMAAYLLA
jgi:DNA-binding transcriptional regulator LsrR (DeoR family)